MTGKYFILTLSYFMYITRKFTSENKKFNLGMLKSPSEAFADAFADYFGNNGNKLPDYIKAFFEERVTK